LIAGVLLLATIVYGVTLARHVKRSMNPLVFNNNVRQQIFPFFGYHEAGLFPHDYFVAYYRACFFPVGYHAFYRVGANFWDPAGISKVLPYILLALTAAAVVAAARPLAGYFGALLAAALLLSNSVVFSRMVGGLPRAFAFPALAFTAVALVYGKPRLLAGVVCVSAGFYPPAAVVGGIALALWLFLLPGTNRGDAADWDLPRRVRLVIVTASLSALILLPTVIGARVYGRPLGPKDVAKYPELGPHGRYGEGNRPPFNTFPQDVLQEARALFRPVGQPLSKDMQQWARVRPAPDANSNGDVLLEFLTGVLLVGGIVLAAQGSIGRRFLLLGAAAWVGHLAARALAPYLFLPERYVGYPVTIVLILLIPAVGAALGAELFGGRRLALGRAAGVIALAAIVLLPFGGRGYASAGLNVDVTSQRPLYDFLSKLPKDALIAGWPSDLDSVPYVSRRQAFITGEVHQVFHQRYADEMRRRMRAVIDAYFATSPDAIKRLRDEFGVTHLIFQPSLLEKPPPSCEPFIGWIRDAFNEGRSKGFEIPRQVEATKVFSDGAFVVLELRRLSAP
jgi:hypothetical protein